jgi:hypothetical protein
MLGYAKPQPNLHRMISLYLIHITLLPYKMLGYAIAAPNRQRMIFTGF